MSRSSPQPRSKALGKEDTALPNAREQNPWHPFASTSCSMCPGLPRCFKSSHSPAHHCISPAVTLLSSSSLPTVTIWIHGCWESPEPRAQARTVHITRTLIHSSPGTALIQTKWSCQKKIILCQVWHLYVSWEHVVVTGVHTADNMTNFSSSARHWDKAWKLCWKKLPMPPWRIWSIRQSIRGTRNLCLQHATTSGSSFFTAARWDCTQETETCAYSTSIRWRPGLQWRSFALQYR